MLLLRQNMLEEVPVMVKTARHRFCPDPIRKGDLFTKTYEEEPSMNFVSVNPGNTCLSITQEKSLNGQFGKDLTVNAMQDVSLYERFFMQLYQKALAAKSGDLVSAPASLLAENKHVMAAFGRRVPHRILDPGIFGPVGQSIPSTLGFCILVVFEPGSRVFRKAQNCGMVYVVGADRRTFSSDRTFLLSVEAIAENLMETLNMYNRDAPGFPAASSTGEVSIGNRWHPWSLPRIEQMRMCFLSGGQYRGLCSEEDVCKSLLTGLLAGYNERDSPSLEFAFHYDIFRTEWERMLRRVKRKRKAPDGVLRVV